MGCPANLQTRELAGSLLLVLQEGLLGGWQVPGSRTGAPSRLHTCLPAPPTRPLARVWLCGLAWISVLDLIWPHGPRP